MIKGKLGAKRTTENIIRSVKIMSERKIIVHLKIEAILDTMDDVCIRERC